MVRHPPDILITTPESLYLMLTSQARKIFEGTEWVIVDEIHAVAADQARRAPRDHARAARRGRPAATSSGSGCPRRRTRSRRSGASWSAPKRTCTIVDTGVRKPLDLKIHVPVESMVEPEQGTNGADARPVRGRRGDAQVDLAGDLPGDARAGARAPLDDRVRQQPARARSGWRCGSTSSPRRRSRAAHHGSLAREERAVIEEQLKAGELPCLVATSSLELGIDMGAVDLVLQVESPKSVARGLQRIGRAGHNVGETSKGRIFPKFRADLLECAVVAQAHARGADRDDGRAAQPARRARAADRRDGGRDRGRLTVDDAVRARHAHAHLRRAVARAARERARHARRPLPVRGVRRAAPAHRVGPRRRARSAPRKGSRALAITNAGTIPDRGLFSRQPARRPPRRRARRGDGLRGAAGPDLPARRVDVADRGDHPRPRDRHAGAGCAGRGPVLAGRRRRPAARARRGDRRVLALGGATRTRRRWRPTTTSTRCAAANLLEFLREQQEATRVVPSDRTIVIERFRDEIGDWRLCVLSPYGGRVHAAWGLALSAPHPRRVRPRVRRDLVRRRHHRPPPRRRRAAGRGARADRAGRGRGARGRRARRQRAVRRALPRERRPRAADPARLPGQAHAAVAAAAEVADAARGRQALRRSSRSSSRPTASACATCSTCRA